MKALKIFVLGDNEEDAGRIRTLLAGNGYHICGIATRLQDAYTMFDALQPDISIVDVYMQGKKDGLLFAEAVYKRQKAKHPLIFLTNAYDRATFESARLSEPFNYLLKPFNELQLQYAIELAVEKPGREESIVREAGDLLHDAFFVKRGNVLAKILVNNIQYIEVDGKYCKLAYGNDKFVIQKSMKQLFDELPAHQFVRIHRNYIANLQSIQKINLLDHEVVLQDGKSISFSRRYMDELMQLFRVLK